VSAAVHIAGRAVGPGRPCFVVAEMSANHGQDLDQALGLVDVAAAAGVDAVKLQTYTPDTMTLDTAHPSARVDPVWGARNLYELYRKAYMPPEFHAPLFERIRARGMIAFSTPFDATAVDLLEGLGAPAYKIASFELVDLPLLERVGRTGKPVILSTGMATLGEVEEAIETLRRAGSAELVLLHCCSSYPAAPETVNLRAMVTLARAFGLPVGFSDHTLGTAVPVAAVALGASVIEKHFTDDNARPGPDHRFSADPGTLRRLVEDIRAAEAALAGDGLKRADPSEEVNKQVGRRSLFAARRIPEGAPITADAVRVVRPGAGLHPRYLELVVGRAARRDIPAGHPITWEDV